MDGKGRAWRGATWGLGSGWGAGFSWGCCRSEGGTPKTPEALWEQSRGSQQLWLCLQACRGGQLDQGVFLETDSGQPEPCSFSEYLRIPPNTAVMFACSPGKETLREPKPGGNTAGSNASPLPLQATEPS